MTPSEFKAWFEGFSEGIEGVPTLKQWEKIKARAAEIDGRRTVETVFVDRYWPGYVRPYYPFTPYTPHWSYLNQCSQQLAGQNLSQAQSANDQMSVANRMNLANQVLGPPPDYAEALKRSQAQISALQSQCLADDYNNSNAASDNFDAEEAMRELGRKDRSEIN